MDLLDKITKPFSYLTLGLFAMFNVNIKHGKAIYMFATITYLLMFSFIGWIANSIYISIKRKTIDPLLTPLPFLIIIVYKCIF